MWSRAANAFLDQNAVDEIIGSGMLSSAEIAQSQNITTLDNTYLTILYEQGIAGIFIFLFVFATLLWRLRFFAQFSLHWYGILALLVVGQTFVTQGYSTFNFIAVSSIALMLSFRTHKSTQ